MAAHGPDFAALAEEALVSADTLIEHLDWCNDCGIGAPCRSGGAFTKDYRTKKDKALKALRGRKK
jgi:hypothetical protein